MLARLILSAFLPSTLWAQGAPVITGSYDYCGTMVDCNGLTADQCDAKGATYCASRAEGGAGGGLPSSGGGLSWQQQMQLDMARDITQAAANAFVKWLLAPSGGGAADRIRQQNRLREIEEQARRQLAAQERQRARRMQAQQQEVANDMKGLGDDLPDGFKDLDARFDTAFAALRNQVVALDCGMSEVYEAAESFGPKGRAFVADLRKEVLAKEQELPASQASGAANSCDGIAYDQQNAVLDKDSGAQMTVELGVTRFNDQGERLVRVLYSIADTGGKSRYGQEAVLLAPDGGVECQEVTPGAAKCLSQLHAGVSDQAYCPRPPVDQGRGYAACQSPTQAPSGRDALADLRAHFQKNRDWADAWRAENRQLRQDGATTSPSAPAQPPIQAGDAVSIDGNALK